VRIIGIDCGSERTGYGVIDSNGKKHSLVAAGVIRTSPKDPFPERLRTIYRAIRKLMEEYTPEAVAVEDIFYAANVKTALKLAHVRGVTLCAAADAGVQVGEYSPLEVKGSVVGYGRADKSQVQLMVQSLLRLPEPVKSLDASDALAVSICHANLVASRINGWVK
jgi:crossover junction endodeoxyribonuclease RuvC